jgi:hypothetical protein
MRFLYSFITSIVIGLFGASDIPYSELEQAFNSSDAQAIASMGKDKFMINVFDKEGIYSTSQATLILKDFFSKKPVTSFKFTFKGKESNENTFALGEYISKNESFKVSIQFKKLKEQTKIERLSIEK